MLLVIAAGVYVVSDLRGAFGSEKRPTYAGSYIKDGQTFKPKQLTYEVFGPTGAVADISYFGMKSQPQQVEGASLPWSLTINPDSPAVIGSIVAQGNDNSIGCRIVVDGDVRIRKNLERSEGIHALPVSGRVTPDTEAMTVRFLRERFVGWPCQSFWGGWE